MPYPWYWKAMHGVEGRDEQIENYRESLRALGEAGVRTVGFVWALLGFFRSETTPTGRGGVTYPRWDEAVARRLGPAAFAWRGLSAEYPRIPHREIHADEIWANLRYFLEAVLPVAEEAGIRLCVHPDDPPVSEFMGVDRILCTPDDLQRFVDLVPSEHLGLLFCVGTIGTMAGVDPVAEIARFGKQERIFYVHLRNPRGSGAFFEEVLSDEGDLDLGEVLEALQDVAFDGLVQIDHSPALVGKDGRRRSTAYQFGYALGLARRLGIVDERTTDPGGGR